MCGICGIVGVRDQGEWSRDALIRMRDTMVHRGPDEAGIFLGEGVGLGHRRLSIIDVACGQQPMCNEDESLWIVFNGEIYNHANFRPILEKQGHRYKTSCDTETILHLFEERGEEAVDGLRGMFAFGIWNTRTREMFLARDRLGVKPLYYVHNCDGTLYFSSEIKALIAARAVRPQLNIRALPDYLANHAVSGEETLFAGVKRLAPGHFLWWKEGKVTIQRYWDLDFSPKGDHRTDSSYVSEWTERFQKAVRMRLMSEVPLGVFLSGGIDSSAIAATMSSMVDAPIQSFSVGFSERDANELGFARIVSDAFKTTHREVLVSSNDFFQTLPRLVWQEDEPLAHPSSVPLYFLSELASEHVKVVLTGEGSDELLGGYGRYLKTLANVQIGKAYSASTPVSIAAGVRRHIEGLSEGSRLKHKLLRTFLCLGPSLEAVYLDNFAVFPVQMQARLLSPDVLDQIGEGGAYRTMLAYLGNVRSESTLNQMLYVDTKVYLHELLMKQDQMSMAASIESRVPFLDHELVEFSAQLPDRMKVRGLTTKYILRQSMRRVLPREILTRRKMGFPVPIGGWFRKEHRQIVDDYVLGSRAMSRGLFRPEVVKGMVEQHCAGVRDHSSRIWSLLNLEIWMRLFVDEEVPHAPALRKDGPRGVSTGAQVSRV
jgi:asparagine synthase (glutamine-hydrolysing)